MAIADFDTYKTKLTGTFQRVLHTKDSLSTTATRLNSFWRTGPDSVSNPTTAAVPTSASSGALPLLTSSGVQRIAQVAVCMTNGGYVLIADRLSHQGGLSAIVTTEQTTNLPTAALTRYTSGEGVWLGLELFSNIGSTATTVTASYTNQAGTSGRTTVATAFGGTSFNAANRVIVLPLQEGDTGVQSVQSVTVLATTGTAGNFGVVLFKPLLGLPVPIVGGEHAVFDAATSLSCLMPQVVTNACLFYLIVPNGSTTGVVQNAISIIEE